MGKTAHEIVTSDRFKALVRKRWTVSVILTILLFVSYYGIYPDYRLRKRVPQPKSGGIYQLGDHPWGPLVLSLPGY